MGKLDYQPSKNFYLFLERLQAQAPREWMWLINQFRSRLMPVLMARGKDVGSFSLMTQQEFAEEVFEECLLKFYELFESGVFEKYSDLEATIVRVSNFKIKEGFARIKRDQRLYFMNAEALAVMREKHLRDEDTQEKEKIALIANIKEHLSSLSPDESELIVRFFNGEDLNSIAEDFNISPAACRKRKQRALEKLRSIVLENAELLILLMLHEI